MNKKSILKVLKFVVALLIGVCLGLLIAGVGLYFVEGISVSNYFDKLAKFGAWRFVCALLIGMTAAGLAIYAQVILHEGGHLVCGLATGYKFVSFRIFNLTVIRQKGKLRIKRFSIDGTGGQCLLTPPDLPLEQIPTVLYNIGGVLANVIGVAVAAVILLTVDDMPEILYAFLIIFMAIGVVLALLNGIPMKVGGISNDAKNVRMLARDPKSKRALVIQLRANAMVQEGVRPKDMPEEWFRQEGEIDYKNVLHVAIKIMYAGWLLDKEQWQEAYDVLEDMEAHKDDIVGLYVKEVECELLFAAWVTGRMERAEQLCTDKLLDYVGRFKKVMSSKQRLLCAKALFMDKNAARAKEIYEDVCGRRNSYLMQGEVDSDIAIMQSFLIREGVLQTA